jgi:hypothetical protein
LHTRLQKRALRREVFLPPRFLPTARDAMLSCDASAYNARIGARFA